MSNLEIAVLAGLGGMLGWGLADFFAKKTIDEIGDMQGLAWAHVAGTTILGLIVAERWASGANEMPAAGWSVWAGLALFGLTQGAIYILVYRGFGKGPVSVLNPIFSSYSGLAAALSVLVFGEAFNASRLLLLGVAF